MTGRQHDDGAVADESGFALPVHVVHGAQAISQTQGVLFACGGLICR